MNNTSLLTTLDGTQAPTAEDDQATPIDLDSVFGNVLFWAGEWSEVPKELKQRLEENIVKHLRKGDKPPTDVEVKYQLSGEAFWRSSILEQVDKSGDIQSLEDLLSSVNELPPILTKQWLSSRLLHQEIPECIRNALWKPNDDHTLADPKNPRRSVLKLLAKIRGKDPNGFRGLQYTSHTISDEATGHAHYIGKSNFRHGGNSEMAPETVFIAAPTPPDIRTHKLVHVYYEESGSGKTVELAASAFTRDALFTIMLDTDDVKLLDSPDVREVKRDRRGQSWARLKGEVESVLTRDKKSLGRLANFLKALDKDMQKKTTLFIVVGIDEASKSPNFVRAIIDSHKDFGTDLGKFILHMCAGEAMKQVNPFAAGAPQGSSNANKLPRFLKHIDIEVLFSVAGTGADQARVGSNHKNFDHRKISAKENVAHVYHVLRREYVEDVTNTIIPEYAQLEHSPLLKAIVDSNARMISIYMRVSTSQENINRGQRKKSSENEYEQNAILSKTFAIFMESNGMKALVHNPYLARLTASRALAALLFQQNEAFSKPLTDTQLNNMDYGITFQRFKGDLGGSIMRRLVVDYGLVTARPLTVEDESKPQASPFALTGAMQLLCLWLIQGGEATAAEKSFLGTTSTSFETLTALLAGAAIAASSVVKKDTHGRVVAAPANGPNSDTIQQQEADIIAALSKVGMKIKPHPDDTQPTHYTCKTIGGEKSVEDGPGHLFWSLKGTHPAQLPGDLGISRVYFHKSMMTCVESGMDKQRIMDSTKEALQRAKDALAAEKAAGRVKDATVKALNPVFRNMWVTFPTENRGLGSRSLADCSDEEVSSWLNDCYSIFVDHDLLHKLVWLWKVKEQFHDQQPTTETSLSDDMAVLGISGSTNTSRSPPANNAKPATSTPAPANPSQGTTVDVVEIFFNLPLIHVAEGSSEFADAYVTFLTEETDATTRKKIYKLRTICIQAKDHGEDTSSDMKDYKKNASAVANPGLHTLFGGDLIYTVAGTQSTVAWGFGGDFPYVPFVVDKSIILKNQMDGMAKRRNQTAKHGAHAELFFVPYPR